MDNTGIFYFSTNPGPNRWPVYVGEKLIGFVRAEISSMDLVDALDEAEPQDDEDVMNTHEVIGCKYKCYCSPYFWRPVCRFGGKKSGR